MCHPQYVILVGHTHTHPSSPPLSAERQQEKESLEHPIHRWERKRKERVWVPGSSPIDEICLNWGWEKWKWKRRLPAGRLAAHSVVIRAPLFDGVFKGDPLWLIFACPRSSYVGAVCSSTGYLVSRWEGEGRGHFVSHCLLFLERSCVYVEYGEFGSKK